jgi:hypothetical protein
MSVQPTEVGDDSRRWTIGICWKRGIVILPEFICLKHLWAIELRIFPLLAAKEASMVNFLF